MNRKAPIPLESTYAQLGAQFSSRQSPTRVKNPQLIRLNSPLAEALNLDLEFLHSAAGLAFLSGNALIKGSEPVASVYAGHQFGHWNPQLGDGRAILLGEVIGRNGQRYDIQLKGSGQTPYSRMGDGLSPLGPVLREYLVSEAMAALGVPTTRSLAAVSSGERVVRDQILPGAILTRVASSHIRVGTFQYFAAQENRAAVKTLADHVIARHFASARDESNPYLAMLNQVIERQAQLIAQWQSFGFIHGVMNTDNMLICGETVDYGPCAFMDEYHPETVFSSIDDFGRYAYQNQPAIGQWNLAWFAQTLIPLLHDKESQGLVLAQEAIKKFMDHYNRHYEVLMNQKIGLVDTPEDEALVSDLLQLMAAEKMDFTLTFRYLSQLCQPSQAGLIDSLIALPESFNDWLNRWRLQLDQQKRPIEETQQQMQQRNPLIIPRNHLVEEAINTATRDKDFTLFHALADALATPFDDNPSLVKFASGPKPEQVVHATFCGT